MIKVGTKLLSDVVIVSIFSSESLINFHDKTLDVLVKNLKYILFEKYIKWFFNFPEQKYLATLIILYLCIKTFVSLFVDILMAHLIYFQQVHVLLNLNGLSSKSVLFTKLAIFFLLAKFANNLFSSGIVRYLSWSWLEIFFSILLIFVL